MIDRKHGPDPQRERATLHCKAGAGMIVMAGDCHLLPWFVIAPEVADDGGDLCTDEVAVGAVRVPTSGVTVAFGEEGCGWRWLLVPVRTEPGASAPEELDDSAEHVAEGC